MHWMNLNHMLFNFRSVKIRFDLSLASWDNIKALKNVLTLTIESTGLNSFALSELLKFPQIFFSAHKTPKAFLTTDSS